MCEAESERDQVEIWGEGGLRTLFGENYLLELPSHHMLLA